MVGLGWGEILILLVIGLFWIAVAAVIVVVVLAQRGRGQARSSSSPHSPQPHALSPPQRAQPSPGPYAPVDAAAASAHIVAQLTQRFCPQCRASLAPDSPEGLCPVCLMAGGLGSAVLDPAAAGMAATTPPSGSRPPATGEWADLQQHFPDLEILELLGRGGMGSVYKARQKNLDRIVALKVIPPDAAKDPAFTERFGREARAMARLNHPNIVTVYNYGHENELCWLLMEYVDGVNLRHTLRASRLEPREALAIVPQICDALQYAHDQGVVHRDIKPENVLLDRSGRVKIADFGLAKLLGKGPDDFTLTRTQQVMGTPRYMAPEQIEKPATVDHRADIYSLGVVLYEMLTGELPLGRFEPPSHSVEIDVRIDQVVMRALEKAPERRYQRASEVKTELASAASWPALARPMAAAATVPQTPPAWHTPAPATKHEFWDPSQPGGVPLRYVLAVAMGMVMGVLMMTAGLAAGIYGIVNFPGFSGGWWGWIGGAFGCVVGGFGSFAGSYNTYRQLTGAEDLMRSPRVTWFDWVMRGYFVLGIVLVIAAMGTINDRDIFQPMMTLSGVVTFQGGLFLMWRTLIRPAAAAGAHLATSAERDLPADPSFLRAIVWPTLAMAAVFAVLLADVHFALPVPGSGGGITAKMSSYRQWHEAILLTGLCVVPLCLLVLGVWRTWGPRRLESDGRWTVPSPLAGRGWLWAVAVLAGLSIVLPWFRLEIRPGAEVVLSAGDIYPQRNVAGDAGTFVPTASVMQNMAAMPEGWRYGMRGLQHGASLAAACLLIFGVVLSAVVPGPNRGPNRPARIIFLLVMGGVGILCATALLHKGADQDAKIVVDDTTEAGIYLFASRTYGSQPQTVEPWKRAIRTAFIARPSYGAFALLAACCLAIFIGVTDASWGTASQAAASKTQQPAAPVERKVTPLDPARQAIRDRVAGPALGLIVVGVLGIVPLLIAALAIPTFTPVKSGGPQVYDETSLGLSMRLTTSPAVLVPLLSSQSGATTGSIAAATLPLPPLAQRPSPMMEARPTTAVLFTPILVLAVALNLAHSATLIIGGWQMRQLRSYGLSIIAAILALLPCTLAWVIGLPVGIWAISLLTRTDVREGFET